MNGENYEVFNKELSRINNIDIRWSTRGILELLPDYFFEMPASTSGKYHPQFSLGEGGLVRHTKVACRILEEMFNNSSFSDYTEHKKDLIRMAVILHDGFKSGKTYSEHTLLEHPLLMADFLLENQENLLLNKEDINFVARLISTHMGPWTIDKSGKEVLPKPTTKEELLVHLCDYIASRNFLNVSFENNEIVDSVNREEVRKLEKKL
ncbi:MAG: HD domain-containing protein [Bacilli bacterium]|nr:HD domain-containing protein [Bacilli bacterium]